jgi:hypothetical protein
MGTGCGDGYWVWSRKRSCRGPGPVGHFCSVRRTQRRVLRGRSGGPTNSLRRPPPAAPNHFIPAAPCRALKPRLPTPAAHRFDGSRMRSPPGCVPRSPWAASFPRRLLDQRRAQGSAGRQETASSSEADPERARRPSVTIARDHAGELPPYSVGPGDRPAMLRPPWRVLT